ncbi:hypothetical protein RBU49_03830 [Clostridium sp. MB40-C1]|uniref:hypothetical protein n=1 Tax=Clostridium sp. MB40-C1 TaxID=3070996 RepID=UPI0027DED35F|nr:hypothetical protein [Clostridium sp. MB40-C1]WMJ81398.1 hypothetical protein RBU49_03830 [Clostridium sp. MB40-C1]
MSTAFRGVLIVLGILQIILGFKMEVLTKKKYQGVKVRNMEALIKWEKVTTILMGIAILLFATLDFSGTYQKYSTAFISGIVVLMVVTHFGRKKFI